ncbi:glycosyltransferase [Brachybacterium sp. p3-SID1565]|uniref:glycosyltransferase n=1 Tax=Brachybacterium sp. p3-SID1565 TaxID=2916046 RepID=UPI0021A3E60B|nr:glycosyltransferase [Brachybacterium sp. p3-SID1565]MCT1385834.1 glycosyltransferase [Brachybacterium sp. p3-SID1565]
MRVLHVTEASSAGVLTAVTTLVREQSQDPAFTDPVLAYVPRPDSPPTAAIRELTGDGAEVRAWSAGTPLRLLHLAAALLHTLRREQFDVIHLHSSKAGLLGRAVAAAAGARHRTVYSPHCFSFDRSDIGALRRAMFLALERAALHLSPRLVLVSDSEARVARTLLPRSRTAVVHNRVPVLVPEPAVPTAAAAAGTGPATAPGNDPDTGGLASSDPLDASPALVVHVGRIATQKRPALFCEIAARVRAEQPQVRFRWIGDGDRDLLDPAVETTGWLPAEQVREQLAEADLVLFTSAGEGLPMALLEAQALARPVVASEVTGVTEVIDHHRTGLLGRTAEELAHCTLTLLRDPQARERLGRHAAEQVRQKFDARHLASDCLTAYRTLMKDTP